MPKCAYLYKLKDSMQHEEDQSGSIRTQEAGGGKA